MPNPDIKRITPPLVEKVSSFEKPLTKLIFAGDVMMGRSVRNKVNQVGDYNYPFIKIMDFLKNADIIYANLENPIVDNCEYHDSGFKFCSDLGSVKSLTSAGINVVSLTNNHSGNYGRNGVEQTKKILTENGIKFTLNDLAVREVNGIKFGFLGFDFTLKKPTLADYELIKRSDPLVDFLIVVPHWGVEYKPNPETYQREWAEKFLQNGTELVIGSHPHWVQGVDCINGADWQYIEREVMYTQNLESKCDKLVFYSLGNFVFDQMWSEETKKGLLVEIGFDGPDIYKVGLRSTYIKNVGQPNLSDY